MVIFLKNKIKEIYVEYKNDFIKYYNNIIKTIKMVKKFLINNLVTLKTRLLCYENRKKNLTITFIAIVFNLLLLNFYVSYGAYHIEQTLPFLQAVVGNHYKNQYDYVLFVYVENTDSYGIGNGEYRLANEIPIMGYNYSGYKCQNNSKLFFDEVTKTTNVTAIQKDICSIYFDSSGRSDLAVKIMLETDVESNTYSLNSTLPVFGYKYSYYECANNGKLEYNSNLHKVILESSGQEYCEVYFKKEKSDINVNLYVEEHIDAEKYVNRNTIPTNVIYKINENLSICKKENERIDAFISYVEGYIEIEVDSNASCDIYLEQYEE